MRACSRGRRGRQQADYISRMIVVRRERRTWRVWRLECRPRGAEKRNLRERMQIDRTRARQNCERFVMYYASLSGAHCIGQSHICTCAHSAARTFARGSTRFDQGSSPADYAIASNPDKHLPLQLVARRWSFTLYSRANQLCAIISPNFQI